ncbi:hypothetical protein Tco_1083507 [Tanacetum coccineum]
MSWSPPKIPRAAPASGRDLVNRLSMLLIVLVAEVLSLPENDPFMNWSKVPSSRARDSRLDPTPVYGDPCWPWVAFRLRRQAALGAAGQHSA